MNDIKEKEIFITGKDWQKCYMQEDTITRDQVLSDLEIEVNERQECFQVGDIFCIDVITHSTACEMFEVHKILREAIFFTYAGGAS